MPLTQAQGLLLSNDILMRHILEDSPFVTQLVHFFRFFEVDGDTERWATTSALPTALPIGFGQPLTEQTTVPASRTYSFGQIATAREVLYNTQDLQSNVNDQSEVQLRMALQNLHYGFWRLFILGNPANPGEFAGLDSIISGAAFAGQIVDALGLALTTRMLDRAQRRVRTGDNFEGFIYTSPQGYVEIRQAFLGSGTLPQEVAVTVPDGNGGFKAVSMMHVNGWLVTWSDFVPTETFGANTVTKIWFLKLGARRIHGIVPSSTGQRSMIRVRSTILTQTSALRYDLTFPVGISVPSVSDIAVIRNVLVQPL